MRRMARMVWAAVGVLWGAGETARSGRTRARSGDGAKGVYVVEDAYRPGAIAPGALAGRTIAWSFLVFREFA